MSVHVYNGCSSGLQYNGEHCVCNPFLAQHHFICTIRTNTTTYKAGQLHYWIGVLEEHVMLSTSCPVFFCNSVLQSGLTIDNTVMTVSNASMVVTACSAVNAHQVTVQCLALSNVKSAPVCGYFSYHCMH